MPQTRGIPELPQTATKTIVDKDGVRHTFQIMTQQHQQFFSDVREQLLQLRQNQATPDPITNLKATAIGFGASIQWTRSGNADYYEIIHATKPSLNDPSVVIVDVGNSNIWAHNVGSAGVTNFYWVRARKQTGSSSLTVGPVSAITLAAATGTALPPPPPAANILVIDRNTGRTLPYDLSGGQRSYRQ